MAGLLNYGYSGVCPFSGRLEDFSDQNRPKTDIVNRGVIPKVAALTNLPISNQSEQCGPTPRAKYSTFPPQQTKINNFLECPHCEHYLHVDYFPPARLIWGRFFRPCKRCVHSFEQWYKTVELVKLKRRRNARRKTNDSFRIAHNLRVRLNSFVKGDTKAGSHIRDLGCTVDHLKAHLESLFEPGMGWDNYGSGFNKWNIDHISPLSGFDLSDRQHFLLACNYLNLQPMWHLDNIRKGGAKRLIP